MDSATLRGQLSEFFGDVIESDEKLCEECVNMCRMFNISAEDLFYKWEAFKFDGSGVRSFSSLTMESADALRSQIQRGLATKSLQTKHPLPGNIRGLDAKFLGSNVGRTDTIKTEGTPIQFLSRLGTSVTRSDRYMYQKTSERSEALDDHIDEIAELVRDHYKISELGDPASTTEDDVTIVGRIVLDSESSSGQAKLNEASLALESSRMMGSGARVPLRFDSHLKVCGGARGMNGIGLFPGAIVALRGKNGGGGWFLVNEVLELPRMMSQPRSVESIAKAKDAEFPFSMCIVSGPYTPDSDLRYKPWHQLLESIKSTAPAVVLLLGPFVDCSHSQVKNGDIEQSPTQLFREQFSDQLSDFFSTSPNSLVLLVPSVRDIVSSHAAFPQCELGSELATDSRVLLLPNPCRFCINGVSFAVSTVDVLFHLRKEEYFKKAEEVESIQASPEDLGNDPMANLCRHLLQQRSFYPLFPVPLDLSHEVNLDVSHLEGLKLGNDQEDEYAPDILILPSRLKGFSKVVFDTMAINPSPLTKGQYSILSFEGQGAGSPKDKFKIETMKLQ